MNLLQRALGRRRSFSVPQNYDPLLGLYGRSGRPINGEFEVTSGDLDQIVENVYKQSGPVFALIAVRMLLFSEARYAWRKETAGRLGEFVGNDGLELLEQALSGRHSGGNLAMRAEQDVSLMGNSFITNRNPGRLKRLRPDWTFSVWGSDDEPDLYGDALDGELLGYVYLPRQSGAFGIDKDAGTILLPDEVAHYAPYPDPQQFGRGMSWLTPVLREISADNSALAHKDAFFRNSASPRLAMKVDPSVDKDAFEALVAMMESQHTGPFNAYKTLYVGGGADPVPLTFSLRDIDYKNVVGGGETRLASAAGVPSTIVGFSEGMQGSALNAGNYGQTRRRLGDGTMRPLWREFASSLESLFPPPDGQRLGYDDRDIAFLREDKGDAATIQQTKASTVSTLVNAGYDPEAVIAAVEGEDLASLKGHHTGLFSVQLQPPSNGEIGEPPPTPTAPPTAPKPTEPTAPTDGQGKP